MSCGWVGGWVAVGSWMRIMPSCGSILQAETCQILSLAKNPRWSPSVAKIQFQFELSLDQLSPGLFKKIFYQIFFQSEERSWWPDFFMARSALVLIPIASPRAWICDYIKIWASLHIWLNAVNMWLSKPDSYYQIKHLWFIDWWIFFWIFYGFQAIYIRNKTWFLESNSS